MTEIIFNIISLDSLQLWLLILILLAGGLVHGTLGMGFPMITTPLIALMVDVRSAMLLVLLPTLAVNLMNMIAGGHWKDSIGRFWPLAVYGAFGSILGTRLLIATDPAPYKLLMAIVILLYLYVNRFGLQMGWIRKRPGLAMAIFGFSGGILAGTVNVMLPALIIFALEAELKPRAMIQTFNFCFLCGKLSQTLVFAASGVLTGPIAIATLPLALIVLLILFVGMKLRRRIDVEAYRRWLKGILFLISLVLIAQYILAILPD